MDHSTVKGDHHECWVSSQKVPSKKRENLLRIIGEGKGGGAEAHLLSVGKGETNSKKI